jgi:hypothetical protein
MDALRAGAKGGLISTANFTNSSAGADYVDSTGAWLSGPDATLFTLGQNGHNQALLVLLGNPMYDAQNQVSDLQHSHLTHGMHWMCALRIMMHLVLRLILQFIRLTQGSGAQR